MGKTLNQAHAHHLMMVYTAGDLLWTRVERGCAENIFFFYNFD